MNIASAVPQALAPLLGAYVVVALVWLYSVDGVPLTRWDIAGAGLALAGMAGVAVDPNFASNRFIYVYSTSSLTAPGTNRVIRLKVNEAMTAVSDRTDIVADIGVIHVIESFVMPK